MCEYFYKVNKKNLKQFQHQTRFYSNSNTNNIKTGEQTKRTRKQIHGKWRIDVKKLITHLAAVQISNGIVKLSKMLTQKY